MLDILGIVAMWIVIAMMVLVCGGIPETMEDETGNVTWEQIFEDR